MQERWRRKKAGGGGSVADLTSKFETNSIKTTPVNPVAPPRRTSLAQGEKPLLSTHQEPTPTDPGTPRYGTAGREAPPPSSTGAAADELGDAAVAELAELAAEAARLAAEATLSLEASLAVETAKWRLRAAVGGEGGKPRCALSELHDAICSARAADAGRESKWPQLAARAEKAAAAAVSCVLEAKREVIDPNMKALKAHLQRLREEEVGTAVGSMASGALRSVTRAKALAIQRCLMAVLDDVEQQFVGGVEQASRPGLSHPFRKRAVARALCATAVHAHRLEMEAEYALPDIEQELRERVGARDLPELKTLGMDSGKPPSMEQAPLSFLAAVVMGSAGLGVPAPVSDWLCVQVHPRTTSSNDPSPGLSPGWLIQTPPSSRVLDTCPRLASHLDRVPDNSQTCRGRPCAHHFSPSQSLPRPFPGPSPSRCCRSACTSTRSSTATSSRSSTRSGRRASS